VFSGFSFAKDLKIAFVDRQFVFEEFEETGKVESDLKSAQDERQQKIDGKRKKMDKMLEEFKELKEKKDEESQKKAEEMKPVLEGKFAEIKEMHQEYLRQLQVIEKEKVKDLKAKINESIQALAKKKGFDLVLEKEAVYFGGADITEMVIKELNK
jgi:outer membrane protein